MNPESLPFIFPEYAINVTQRAAVLLFLLFLSTAFVLTHLPGGSLPDIEMRQWLPAADKYVHFALYFFLAGFLANYLRFFIRSNRRIAIATMGLLLLYAAFDEWSQQFAPSRSPDFYDFVADVCGAFVGVSTFAVWRWFRRSRRRPTESKNMSADVSHEVARATVRASEHDSSETTASVASINQTRDQPPTPTSVCFRDGTLVR